MYAAENADQGNVISHNTQGINFYDCTAGVAAGNLIGTDASGTVRLGDYLGLRDRRLFIDPGGHLGTGWPGR